MPSPWIYASTAAGVALTLVGAYVCLRWYSFWKSNYRGELLTHGPYERVRHPFYSAFLIFVIGLVILFPIYETVMLAGISVVVIIFYVGREEEALLARYGNTYREYMRRAHWRLVPRIY